MENVLGFISFEEGEVYREFLERFKKLGYTTQLVILRADEFGVPQKRERIFFIGSNNGKFGFLLTTQKPVSVGDAIGDLPSLPEGGGGTDETEYTSQPKTAYQELMRRGSQKLFNHISTKSSPHVVERIKHVPQGGNWKNIPKELMNDYKDLTKTHSHVYKRLEWKGQSPTIANFRKAVLLHPKENRILSVREAARLQSFPDRYRFFGKLSDMQQQVADAVPPLLAKSVAEIAWRIL